MYNCFSVNNISEINLWDESLFCEFFSWNFPFEIRIYELLVAWIGQLYKCNVYDF